MVSYLDVVEIIFYCVFIASKIIFDAIKDYPSDTTWQPLFDQR